MNVVVNLWWAGSAALFGALGPAALVAAPLVAPTSRSAGDRC